MQSHKIKSYVKNFCNEFHEKSSLFILGNNNGVTIELVTAYIANLEFLFRENALQILKASNIYKEDQALSNYFMSKWKEEVGHDKWANNDLKKLNVNESSQYILTEIQNLTNFLDATLKTSPYNYIGYMYFAEYMTANLGPTWLEMIHKNTGLMSQQVSALKNHVDLDGDHAQEVGIFIDSLKLDANTIDGILIFYEELDSYYHQFFNKLSETYGKKSTATQNHPSVISTSM